MGHSLDTMDVHVEPGWYGGTFVMIGKEDREGGHWRKSLKEETEGGSLKKERACRYSFRQRINSACATIIVCEAHENLR